MIHKSLFTNVAYNVNALILTIGEYRYIAERFETTNIFTTQNHSMTISNGALSSIHLQIPTLFVCFNYIYL